jgi:hypothetical protein
VYLAAFVLAHFIAFLALQYQLATVKLNINLNLNLKLNQHVI